MELGGVSVYLSEIATPGHKGFYVSWQSASQQAAVMFAALIGVILNTTLPAAAMAQWGWRVPLLIGCAIVPLLFSLRRSLEETDEFLARRHHPATAGGAPLAGRQLAADCRRHDARHDDDGVVLHDHRVHADIRQLRAAPVEPRQPRGHALRRRVESDLAAGDGCAVGSHRTASAARGLHAPDAGHRLSGDAVAGRRAVVLAGCSRWSSGCRSSTAATTARWSSS